MTATPSTGADGIPKSLPSRSRSRQPPRRVFNGTPAVESGDDEFLTPNRGLVLDPDQRPKNRRFKSGPTEISLHCRAVLPGSAASRGRTQQKIRLKRIVVRPIENKHQT